jgi:hypothetical protein
MYDVRDENNKIRTSRTRMNFSMILIMAGNFKLLLESEGGVFLSGIGGGFYIG